MVVGSAICETDGVRMSPLKVKLSGIGKYPFFELSDSEMDFGEGFCSETYERSFEIFNRSFVSYHYFSVDIFLSHSLLIVGLHI